jgi:hypothetical protein
MRRFVFAFFDKVDVRLSDQARLLGVSREACVRAGTKLTSPSSRTIERMTEILRCYVALQRMFPGERKVVFGWWHRTNTALPPSPIRHAMRHGIRAVRIYLEGHANR